MTFHLFRVQSDLWTWKKHLRAKSGDKGNLNWMGTSDIGTEVVVFFLGGFFFFLKVDTFWKHFPFVFVVLFTRLLLVVSFIF